MAVGVDGDTILSLPLLGDPLLPWLLLLACAGSDELPPPDTGAGSSDLSPCDPALSLSPQDAAVDVFGFVQLQPSGGTGAYLFSLEGVGQVAEESGAFLAGLTLGMATVTVVDQGCLGSATAEIQVVDTLSLLPEKATLAPGQTLAFEAFGGAETACSLYQDSTGASLDADCLYTAGPVPGVDQVRLVDAATGAFAAALITVSESASFLVWGHEHVYLPEGARFDFEPIGGSGAVQVTVVSGDVVLDGNTLSGGSGTVRVQDRYISTWIDVQVHKVSPLVPDAERDGERSGLGSALYVGDVNGDGYNDALMGTPEVSSGAYYGGQVQLYAGTSSGLSLTPAQIWTGDTRYEALGMALAQGDLNGDGYPELLIGSGGIDRGATNNGGVHIFAGQAGAFWGDTPSQSLYGVNQYDRFGDALALCDFDADGWLDLAVGAPDSEDQAGSADAQGSVQVFKGSSDGFGDEPDFVLWGQLPDGEAWRVEDDANFGEALSAGDYNGDGLCDVAAGGTGADAVAIWAGTLAEGLGLERTPSLVLLGEAGDFGRSLASGDVDGDGQAELLVSHWDADILKSNGGATFLFANLDLSGGATQDSDQAAWTVYGTASSDYVGSSVAMEDLDGDGRSEVMIGAYRVEDDTRTNNGVVLFYDAIKVLTDGTRESSTRASLRLLGPNAGGRFGQVVAPVDLDGLLVFAGYDSEWGIQAGAPWYVPLDGADPELLEFPGRAAGHGFGQAMALLDVNGDGDAQLLMGAPGIGQTSQGANAGGVYAYDLQGGQATSPESVLGGHHSWTSTDGFGHGFALGDFDGDGRQDLAVAARKDSKLSGLDDSYANPDACAEYVALAGSVLIYRGRGAGFASDPTWIVHAPDSYGYIDALASGFDLDGDGKDELAFGGQGWHEGGGFALAFGRDRDSSGTLVVCDALSFEGENAFDRLGTAFIGLGDLDGDGCDELAIGATGTEYSSDYYNQGIVHLLWGWSASCGDQIQVSALSMRSVGGGIGASLDAADVDGDGLQDLLVGGAEQRAFFAEMGGIWVSPGHYLQDLPRATTSAGLLPELGSVGFSYLVPQDGLEGVHGLLGPGAASLFGQAVAWVELPDGGWAAAVGVPQGALGGSALSGGVALYRYRFESGAWGLESVPFAVVGGESAAELGGLGSTLRSQRVDGESYLMVGAPLSSAAGLDLGAGYLVLLE
ncbi:MAG: hypothetical protein ACI9VR_003913 [Cognaticolwellia sp.]|jgi:hypothetical protein